MHRLIAVVVFLCVLAPAGAFGQLESIPEDQAALALELFGQARTAAMAGEWNEAVDLLERSLDVLDDPRIRRQLARVLRDADRLPEAVVEYERVIEEDESLAPGAREELAALLEANPGRLVLSVIPPDALVRVDGEDVGALVDGSIIVVRTMGDHLVEISAEGYISVAAEVTFGVGDELPWEVALSPLPPDDPPESTVDAPLVAASTDDATSGRSRSFVAPAVLGTLALTAAGNALAYYVKAAAADRRYNRLVAEEPLDASAATTAGADAERFQWISAGASTGALLLTGATVYTLVKAGRGNSDRDATLAPIAGPGHVGATFSLEF